MKSKIITIPIKSYSKDKIGLLVIPTLVEILQKKTGFSSTLALNLADSYNDRLKYAERYYELIKDTEIKLDNVWMDTRNKEVLLDEVKKLIELGFVTEKEKNINHCKCGRVDVSSDLIESLDGKCYTRNDNKIICNSCNEEAILENKETLVFTVPKDIGSNIKIIPNGLHKQIIELNRKIEGNDIIISRQRNTGYQMNYNDTIYNIDVDFVWQNYLASFSEDEKIVIGSNHTLYAMYMTNLIERCKNPDKSSTMYIGVPHVKGLEDIQFKQLSNEEKKLCLGFATCRMKNSDSKWEQQEYEYISKLNPNKKQEFFDRAYSIIPRGENETLEDYISKIVFKEIKFQKAIEKKPKKQIER